MAQNGTRANPEFGSVSYHMSGADRDHVSAHEVTIAVPAATRASLGLPHKRRDNGVWIMNAGTSTAHIMIQGADSPRRRFNPPVGRDVPGERRRPFRGG